LNPNALTLFAPPDHGIEIPDAAGAELGQGLRETRPLDPVVDHGPIDIQSPGNLEHAG
jgi:hypothetical protein